VASGTSGKGARGEEEEEEGAADVAAAAVGEVTAEVGIEFEPL